jgi:hypothetical protein
VDWNQLKTGDCFNGFADTAGWKDAAVSPTRVDCRSMHEEEVTGTFTLPGGRHYPGDLAIEDASDARCETYFDRYVGIDWDSSDYFYDYLTSISAPRRPADWGDTKPTIAPRRRAPQPMRQSRSGSLGATTDRPVSETLHTGPRIHHPCGIISGWNVARGQSDGPGAPILGAALAVLTPRSCVRRRREVDWATWVGDWRRRRCRRNSASGGKHGPDPA